MAYPPHTNVDPAAEAAALLRRLGFATLVILAPAAALVTRRGLTVLVPIGIFMIVIAATLDRSNRPVAPAFRQLIRSRGGIAAGVVVLWCALSLVWTPFLAAASERLANVVTAIGMTVAGFLALPDRMRSANLYLIPLGVGLAAVLAILLALFGFPGGRGSAEAGQNLDRGLTVLSVMVWPAISWLRSRGRHLEALAIGVLVAVAALLGPQPGAALGLAVGGLAFALTFANRRSGVLAVAAAMGGLLALAPLLPFVLRPLTSVRLIGHEAAWSFGVWRRIVIDEPVRLITGHGFDTAFRGRFEGLLPANAPTTLLFEVWYELGVIGAVAGAIALFSGVLASARNHAALVPGIVGAFATAFALACLGIGSAPMWWLTTLAVVTLLFVAAERGQFRTTRPKARLLQRARA